MVVPICPRCMPYVGHRMCVCLGLRCVLLWLLLLLVDCVVGFSVDMWLIGLIIVSLAVQGDTRMCLQSCSCCYLDMLSYYD